MVEAVRARGRATGRASARRPRREVELAAEIVDAVPSIEMVRFVSSGTEAAMSAIRLARAATRPRPDRQVRGLLPRPRRRAARERRLRGRDARDPVDARACRPAVAADTIVCPFNDLDAAAAAVARYGEGLAAVLVEPVAGNMGVVPPEPGFLEALRALCDASGALLVFDEVITGFRVARGGAQELYGVRARPDDPRQDRRRRPPARGVRRPRRADGAPRPGRRRLPGRHALGQSARDGGRALRAAPPARPGGLRGARARAARGSSDGLAPFGRVQRVGAMLTLFQSDEAVRDFDGAQGCDTERYGALFRHLLAAGVYVAPSQFEAMFVSLAHGDEEIDRTIAAVADFA